MTLHIFGNSHHTISYDQQQVCYWNFCDRQSHHSISYDQQVVSGDIAHLCKRHSHHIFLHDQQEVSANIIFVEGNLITSIPMINFRLWVTLHIFVKSSLIMSFLVTNRVWVTLITFVKGSLTTAPSPVTKSLLVTLHIFVKGNLITPFLWPTDCEWPSCTCLW